MQVNQKLRTLFRVTLFVFMIVELGLWQAMIHLGWNGTGMVFTFAICGAIIFLPLIVSVLMLVVGRGRFGVRTLLLITVCVAVFMSMSAIPYLRFNRDRTAVRWMLANRIDFRSKSSEGGSPLSEKLENEVPFWLRPFVYDFKRFPPDGEVEAIYCSSPNQIEALHQSGIRLPSVNEFVFDVPINDEMLHEVDGVLSQFSNLRSLYFSNVEADRLKEVIRNHPVEHLSLYYGLAIPAGKRLQGLNELEQAQWIGVYFEAATDQDLKDLVGPCNNVRSIMFGPSSTVSDSAFEKLVKELPNTMITHSKNF